MRLTTSFREKQATLKEKDASLDAEISKLKKILIAQQAINSPLRFLTAANLHQRLGYSQVLQHKYDSAINEYWEAIKYSQERIAEILEHTKEGLVGGVSSSDLIKDSKAFIESLITQITKHTLTKSDLINHSIREMLPELIKQSYSHVNKLSKENVIEAIQIGVLEFGSEHTHLLMTNEENMTFITDEDNFHSVDALTINKKMARLYQNAVREIKDKAHIDNDIALKCFLFRMKSAEYYKMTGDVANYFEEMSSAYLYKVYTSKSLDEFDDNYSHMEDVLTEWEKLKHMPRREPYYKRAFASVYGLKFLNSLDLRSKIISLKMINYYLSQAGRNSKNLYILYENFYVIVNQLNNAKSWADVKLPDQKRFKLGDTIKEDVQEIKSNCRDLIKLTQFMNGKKLNSVINDPDLQGIFQLSNSKVITHTVALDLAKVVSQKLQGAEVIPMGILDESADEKVVQNLLKLGESTTVEVKKSFSDSGAIGKAISAFANTKGGRILVGFDELRNMSEYEESDVICKDFVVVGIEGGAESIDDKKKRMSFALSEAGLDVEDLVIDSSLEVRGKRVCVIEVPSSNAKPVFYMRELYKRVDGQNKRLSAKEALDLINKRV